jgi:hypothetical protein
MTARNLGDNDTVDLNEGDTMDVPKAVIPKEQSLWPEDDKLPLTPAQQKGVDALLGAPSVVDGVDEGTNIVEQEALAPLIATVITADKDSVKVQLESLEKEGVEIANSMALKVTDQESYDTAVTTYKTAKEFVDRAGAFLEPFRAITWNIYQKVMGRKKNVLGAVDANLKPLAQEILAFERKKEQERQEKEREAERQRQKEEDDRRLALAEQAKQAGMDEVSIDEILTAPSAAPAAKVAPTFSRVAGTSSREAWSAEPEENLDAAKALKKLVAAAAKKDGAHLLVYLQANMVAINGQARIAKLAMAIPGFRAVDKGSLVNKK